MLHTSKRSTTSQYKTRSRNYHRHVHRSLSIFFLLSQTTNKAYLWDNLQPATKQNVKDSVLSVMIDSDRNIRRAAANIVAAICCI